MGTGWYVRGVADTLTFTATVWVTPGEAGWHFVTLPEELADEVEARYAGPRRGFGAVRVKARIGETRWVTSMFPSTAAGSYILPLKREVRVAEGIDNGTVAAVELEVPDLR